MNNLFHKRVGELYKKAFLRCYRKAGRELRVLGYCSFAVKPDRPATRLPLPDLPLKKREVRERQAGDEPV